RAEWHDRYTLPSLWKFYQPSREAHGSYWFYWTTQDEIEWKNNYKLWMAFVNEFKNRGGRVTTGSDFGFIYKTYGLEYIHGTGTAAGSGIPASRSDSLGHLQRRRVAGPAAGPPHGVRRHTSRQTRRFDHRTRKPDCEPQSLVRHWRN